MPIHLRFALCGAFGFLFSSNAHAQLLQFAAPGEQKISIRTSGRAYHDLRQGSLNAVIPFSQNVDEAKKADESWSLLIQAADVLIKNAGQLPNGGMVAGNTVNIPDHFWNAGLGLQYARHFDEKRFWSASFSIASPSDAPYSSGRVMDFVGNAFYGFPNDENSSWILMLNFSNNRPFLNGIPLPGFAYSYNPSPGLRWIFGFPFAMVYWQMDPRWSFQAFILGASIIKSEVAYRVFGPMSLYAAIDFNQEVYLRKDRLRSSDRFFYAEKKLLLGVRSPLSKVLFADLSAGYAFDRAFFEAEQFNDRTDNQRELSKGGVVGFTLGARL